MLPLQLLAVSLQRIAITQRLALALLGGPSMTVLLLLLVLGLWGCGTRIRGDLGRRDGRHEGSEDEERQDDALGLAVHGVHLLPVGHRMEGVKQDLDVPCNDGFTNGNNLF